MIKPELLLHNDPVDRETIEERRLLETLPLPGAANNNMLSIDAEPAGKGILLKVSR